MDPDFPRLRFSPLDSARFGRRVFRADMMTIDPVALDSALHANRVDTLILRVPADKVGQIASLRPLGLEPVVADTHVEYEIQLRLRQPAPGVPVIDFVEVAVTDSERLRLLARRVFDGYSSHYAANPLFPMAEIADGYADWAARFFNATATPAWFIVWRNQTIGFSCCEAGGSVARGILNGIVPEQRGHGYYRAMLHGMLERFAARDIPTFAIATQVQNIAVQRVWAAAGLRLSSASNTVHINCNFGDQTR